MKKLTTFVFLLNPFGGSLIAFFTLKDSKPIHKTLWLFFCFMFGYFFIVSSGNADYFRYEGRYNYLSNLNFSEFISELNGKIDYLQDILFFIISRFVEDFKIVFGFISILFGYILYKSKENLLPFYSNKQNLMKYLLILIIFSANFLHQINNFRFWIGIALFFLAITYNLTGSRYKYYLFLGLSAIAHFAILPLCIIAILAFYLHKYNNALVFLFILSYVMSVTGVFEITKYLNVDMLTEIDASRSNYLSDSYRESYFAYLQNVNWYVYLPQVLLYFILYSIIIINFKQLNNNKHFSKYLALVLLVGIFYNITSSLPVFERFLKATILLGAFILFLNYGKSKLRFINIVYLFGILFIVVELRKVLDYVNLGLILPSGLISFAFDSDSVFSFFIK